MSQGGINMKIPVQALIIKKMYDNSYDDLRKKYGLTMNEIMLLLYLDKHKMKNTAKEIVDDLMTTKSHISKSIDSLTKDNIIIRIQDEYDRKVIRLFINKNADYILNDLRQREKLITDSLTKGISKENIKIFESVLEQMQKNCLKLLIEEEISKSQHSTIDIANLLWYKLIVLKKIGLEKRL